MQKIKPYLLVWKIHRGLVQKLYPFCKLLSRKSTKGGFGIKKYQGLSCFASTRFSIKKGSSYASMNKIRVVKIKTTFQYQELGNFVNSSKILFRFYTTECNCKEPFLDHKVIVVWQFYPRLTSHSPLNDNYTYICRLNIHIHVIQSCYSS